MKRKLIDENGRLFGKISVIDIFVILIVLIAGVALYVKYNVLETTTTAAETTPITYTLTVRTVRDYTIESLRPGDLLFDKTGGGGNSVGKITDVSYTEARLPSELADGRLVMGSYEDRYDVVITVTADGNVSDGRYLVNKTYELNVNSIRLFYTKYSSFEAVISEIA
jgi:hypothetical protein